MSAIENDPYIGHIVKDIVGYSYHFTEDGYYAGHYYNDSLFVVIGVEDISQYYILKPLQNDLCGLNPDRRLVRCPGVFRVGGTYSYLFQIVD